MKQYQQAEDGHRVILTIIYISKGAAYWALTPCYYENDARVSLITNSGILFSNTPVSSGLGVAPVINLSAEYVQTINGTGTMTDPYTAD